jgi:dUTP pyrophosphatase
MMSTQEVKIVCMDGATMPAYATPGSAGVDLRAHLQVPLDIRPGETVMVSTGLRVQLPQGMEMQVRSRSGLAAKHGVVVANAPGTVDSDYTGEVKVILHNHSACLFQVNGGDRIAQAVFAQHSTVAFVAVEALEETERGVGGFGSTGIK